MQKHSAGIQHIQWHGSSNLFSSGGNEEFFIWAVEQIPGFGIGVICEATCPDPSEERDLRVMNFDVTELSNSSSCLARPYLVISLAYSDSTIRTYTYSKPESFRLVATGKYTSCCLTQIRHISVQDNEIVSLTAGTDGKLALWKMSFNEGTRNSVPGPVKMVLLSTQKIHQNTIKSLDMVRLKNHVLVATGGDDNALGISLYPVSGNVAAITPTRSILRASHATAITGLCFVHDPDIEDRDKSTMLVSSGNDQKVKAWAVRIGKDYEKNFALNIKKIGNVFTPVADVGDVAAFKASSSPGKVLIVGNGIEVWKIPELEGGMT
jgi:WD40 repeat protein